MYHLDVILVNSLLGLRYFRLSLFCMRLVCGLFFTVCVTCAVLLGRESRDLSGTWRFALDATDIGLREKWFTTELRQSIQLPGTLQAQGFGDEVSAQTPWVLSLYDRHWYLREPYLRYAQSKPAKVPFLSQPVRYYMGAAWYQRDIEVPETWKGRTIILFLERARWESTVWIDDRKVGSETTLVAPHEFELGTLAPGRHRLTIRLDNREIVPDYRPDSHSVSDSLGSTWNGMTGQLELRATTPVAIGSTRIFTDLQRRLATIEVTVTNRSGRAGQGLLTVASTSLPITWSNAPTVQAKLEFPLSADTRPWSEFDPALQRVTLRLQGDGADDQCELVFGLRELRTAGTTFLLNGREIHFRGTHHGGDFPLTGYPSPDVDYWRDLFRLCRAWGLNHMRFHSWCPPEAAFTAADEIGFYLQPECGMWNDIDPGTPMEKRLYDETERLLRAYGNHPSFLLLSPSNEPGGRWKESLPPWVARFRTLDPRRLYTTGTGWSLRDQPGPFGDKVDYLAVHRIGGHMMRTKSGWNGKDYDASMRDVDRPNITHEVGQWCAYPDFNVIKKFTGYLRPGNYEIARDAAEAKGLLERNTDFAKASGRLQLACYKEEVEANLRSKKLRGFQLLDLHDYLGQGTALVGLLDPFWQEKGYVTAEQFRRFCSETVPLARLSKRVFTTKELFRAPVEIAHFGAGALKEAVAYWEIRDNQGAVLTSGEWAAQTIAIGNGTPLGLVETKLDKFPAPGAYRLVVGLRGHRVENDWNFWVYPEPTEGPDAAEVRITRSWPEAETALSKGENVLFIPRAADLAWNCPPLDDVPIFWNRLMGPQWSRMLGLWCDPRHPALAGFPTESFGDWQWISIVDGVRALNLDNLPRELQPIVQPIDDWNRNYKLGLLFECRSGPGRLIVSAIDLTSGLSNPVSRQLRASLLSYMKSDRFKPAVELTGGQLRSYLFDTRIMHKLGAEPIDRGLASNAIDGDPNTAWFSGRPHRRNAETRRRGVPEFMQIPSHGYPHELSYRFPRAVAFSGLVLMPRQDHREHLGDIRAYTVSTSEDGKTWNEIARGELPSSFEPKTLRLGQTVTARQIKFTALSSFDDDPSASLAELAVIYDGPPLTSGEEEGEMRYQPGRSATPEIDEGPSAVPTPPAKP